jgi:hypothetical protein
MKIFMMLLEDLVVEISLSDGKGGWDLQPTDGKGGWDRTDGKGGW